jgi:hypothetical protein
MARSNALGNSPVDRFSRGLVLVKGWLRAHINKEIVISRDHKSVGDVMASLGHETGHAFLPIDYLDVKTGGSRQRVIEENVLNRCSARRPSKPSNAAIRSSGASPVKQGPIAIALPRNVTMAYIPRRAAVVAALAAALAVGGCSKEPSQPSQAKVEEATLLAHVAADTPYVFTNVERVPPELSTKLLRYASADLQSTAHRVQAAMAKSESADPRAAALVKAVLDELDGKLTPDGISQLGFRMDAHAVFYGMDMLPVLRLELGNPQAVKDLFKRIETKSGLTAPTAKFGDLEYWRFPLDRAVLVAAVTDGQLIGALVPAKSEARYLPQLFGDELPAQSLAKAPVLTRLLKEYGFTGNGEGYIDFAAITRAVLRDDKGANGGTWRELVPDQAKTLSPQCAALVKSVVAGAPRYVVGTREANGQRYVVRAVLETSPEVGARLQKLAAPVPGLGSHSDALLALGMSMDLLQLREAINALIRTVSTEGKGCEWIDAQKLDRSMVNVDVVMKSFATVAKGFYLEAQDLQLDPRTSMPTKFRGGVLAVSDDPRGLMAYAGMANPRLASLKVPADGTPVAVPADALPPQAPPLYVAAKDKALVVAAGDRAQQVATGLLGRALVRPAPLFAMAYDAGRLMPRLSELSAGALRMLEAQGKTEEAEALKDRVAALTTYGDVFGYVSLSVTGTDKGLVIDQSVDLK